MTDTSDARPFLGWRMLTLAVITAVMTGPGQTIGVSVFIDHLVAALDTSRSLVSSAYLVGTLTGAAAMPFVGRFLDRRGVRLSQTLFGSAFAVALLVMAGVSSLPWLILGFAGIRMFGQGSLSMVSSVTVALWFERRRGVAMGILATAAGALMTLVPVVLNQVIEASGWRVAWLVAAVAVALVVVPLGWFGLVDRPSTVGQIPDGLPLTPTVVSVSTPTPTPASASAGSYTRSEAARTSQFWILVVIGVTSGALITGLNFHQIDLLGEAGLSSGEAAIMFLPQILGSSVAALGVGSVLDRVGTRFVPAFSMVLLVAVHVIAAGLSGQATILLYAVGLGSVGGSVRAALSTMVPGYFGTGHIGSIQGLITVANVAGSAVGPVVLAVTESATGSYRSANLILAVIPVLATAICLFNRVLEPRAGAVPGTLEECVAT